MSTSTSKRRSASKRPLPTIPNGRGPQLVVGNAPGMDPSVAKHFRKVHILMLQGELAIAYLAHEAGKSWRFPFPEQERSDGDPVALAFVGWASGSADDDEIAEVLWPREYRIATSDDSDDEEAPDRDRLVARVRLRRHRFNTWRAGVPFRPWHLRSMRSESEDFAPPPRSEEDERADEIVDEMWRRMWPTDPGSLSRND